MTQPSSMLVLPHRTPENRFVTDLTEVLTLEWIDREFDRLMAHLAQLGDDAAAWEEVVLWHSELHSHLWTHASRISIAFQLATDDEAARAENERLNQELWPRVEERDLDYTRAVLDAPVRTQLVAAYGDVWEGMLRADLITNDPVNADLRARAQDLNMQQARIFGAATINWRGETHPWSYIHKASHDTDTEARRGAHASMIETLQQAEPQLQDIFDELLDLRLKMAANLGLGSYAELRYLEMGRVDWTPADAAVFRDAVAAYLVPAAADLRSEQARQQGVERVHPGDLQMWPEEQPAELAVALSEQLSAVARVFDAMGPEFGNPFRLLMDEGLIDLVARPGKTSGAFCSQLPDYRVAYLFCNSVGTPGDIRTLIHEFGHGLQKWRSRTIEPVFLRQPTLEACEIHSMSLELLALPYLTDVFGGADGRDRYGYEQVRSSMLAVPYMASVDEFQHAIYDPAVPGGLDREARAKLWTQLTSRYQPGIDWAAEPWWHRSRWLAQGHILRRPFYYLDYALAQVVSWQLWLESLEDESRAHAMYLKLCDQGGTQPFRTLVASVGLGDPFDPSTVADVVARLRAHLGLNG